MAFDIKRQDGTIIPDGGLVRIPASAKDTFKFSVEHHNGPAAHGQAVTIETDSAAVFLTWNESHLDAQGKKGNTLGPSNGACCDGTISVKVHGEAAHTFGFRFFKAV